MMQEKGLPLAESILAVMPIGFLELDLDYRIRDLNAASEEILSQSRHSLLNKDCVERIPPLRKVLQSYARNPDSLHRDEVALKGKDYHVHLMPYQKSIAVFLAFKFDPRLREEGSVPPVAAVLAHELKNPLAAIRGAAQLLENKLGEKDRALVDLIKKESDRIAFVIDSYGTIGTAESFSPVNVNEVLNHSVRVARHSFARDIGLKVDFDPSLPEIKGKKNQLIQAVLNLLKNASEAGRSIHLRSHYSWGPLRLEAGGGRQRLGLAIEVEDDGPGIEASLGQKIYEPFFSTKKGNRGFGLAQARQAALDHGGMIEHRSQPTIFRILLPFPEKMNDRTNRSH